MKGEWNPLQRFVLVVAEQAATRGQLKTMLKDMRFRQVFQAANVQGGLDFLARTTEQIDLVICDRDASDPADAAKLPDLCAACAAFPFVLVIPHADADLEVEALDIHASAVLPKPFTADQLEAKLRIAFAVDARGEGP